MVVCVLSWPPHLLSPSSQEKAVCENQIKYYEEVSAECSSGVVRDAFHTQCVSSVCRVKLSISVSGMRGGCSAVSPRSSITNGG